MGPTSNVPLRCWVNGFPKHNNYVSRERASFIQRSINGCIVLCIHVYLLDFLDFSALLCYTYNTTSGRFPVIVPSCHDSVSNKLGGRNKVENPYYYIRVPPCPPKLKNVSSKTWTEHFRNFQVCKSQDSRLLVTCIKTQITSYRGSCLAWHHSGYSRQKTIVVIANWAWSTTTTTTKYGDIQTNTSIYYVLLSIYYVLVNNYHVLVNIYHVLASIYNVLASILICPWKRN